jgi:predicted TIM-barrel fold metal-dependent hydrolase
MIPNIQFCAEAYKPLVQGPPIPLIEVAFETTRTLVDMLYAGTFRRYPNIKFIAAHGRGALPLLADRLELLGTEPWLPSPKSITKEQLSGLYVDTAALGVVAMLTALRLVGKNHVVYGADYGGAMLHGGDSGGKSAEHLWRMRDSPKRRTLLATTSKCCLQRPSRE